MSKLNLFIKGIKRNGLRNAIDVNFLLWIYNVYIYVRPCSLHAFDYIKNHVKYLKMTKFNHWGYKEKDFYWGHLVNFLYSLGLRFIT
jgi:hypothetical protein